jgi:hypothetical protein
MNVARKFELCVLSIKLIIEQKITGILIGKVICYRNRKGMG